MEKTLRRNTGIDLLRIVSMYMAVILHVQGQGGLVGQPASFTAHDIVITVYQALAYCSVSCFGLITGYVTANSGVKVKNLIFLWMQVCFYSFGITLLGAVTGLRDPNREFWLRSMFPVLGGQYWYFTAYFYMMLLAPAAVCAVRHLPQKILRNLLIAVAVLGSLVCTFAQIDPFDYNYGYSWTWLLYLLLLGGYIRRYGAFSGWSSGKLFAGYLGFTAATVLCAGLTDLPQYFYCPILENFNMFSYTSPTELGSAVMLFLCFERLQAGRRLAKFASVLSPFAFGVYLIHVHPVVYSKLGGAFAGYLALPAWGIIIAVPVTAAAIYLLCTLIDWLRSLLFRALSLDRLAGWSAARLASAADWIGKKCE